MTSQLDELQGIVLSIPAIEPSASLRVAYSLRLLGLLPVAVRGYADMLRSRREQREALWAYVDKADRGWCTVLRGEEWDQNAARSSGRRAGEGERESMAMGATTRAANGGRGTGVRGTDRVRLESVLADLRAALLDALSPDDGEGSGAGGGRRARGGPPRFNAYGERLDGGASFSRAPQTPSYAVSAAQRALEPSRGMSPLPSGTATPSLDESMDTADESDERSDTPAMRFGAGLPPPAGDDDDDDDDDAMEMDEVVIAPSTAQERRQQAASFEQLNIQLDAETFAPRQPTMEPLGGGAAPMEGLAGDSSSDDDEDDDDAALGALDDETARHVSRLFERTWSALQS